jgi:uncharacterized Zn finger protein
MKQKIKSIKVLESNFDSTIWGRGKDYYREGRVSKVNKIENIIHAKIQGNRLYSQKIYLETNDMQCTCPYEGKYCKHLAALIMWLKTNTPLDVKDISGILKSKSKGELVSLIKELLRDNPDLSKYIIKPDKDEVKKLIKQLWLKYTNDYGFEEQINFIKEQIKVLNDEEIQILFLRKLLDIRDHDPDGEILDYIEEYLLELEKTRLNKEQRMKIKEILSNYEEFEDYF